MLILTRKSSEAVVVGGSSGLIEQLLKVTVLEIRGTQVKLGFEASAEIPIHRAELWERIRAESRVPGLQISAPRPMKRMSDLD
jgi:carbon storage regulator